MRGRERRNVKYVKEFLELLLVERVGGGVDCPGGGGAGFEYYPFEGW